ncbi:MAG TPA: hypothetical protein VGO00_13335, partial [Kofleriaceae bacterium]|nr:hypothetical protein [Kofleriaceae bacterium]
MLILIAACSNANSAPPPPTEPPTPVERPRALPARVEPPHIGDASVTARVMSARVVAAIDDGVASNRP